MVVFPTTAFILDNTHMRTCTAFGSRKKQFMSSAATEHGTRPLLQSTVDRHIPRQRSSAGHWWEQYEDPENAQPYWVNTTTGEYFHVGQQSSSSSLAATVNRCLASGSVTDELGAATEHTEVFVSVQRSTQSYVLGNKLYLPFTNACVYVYIIQYMMMKKFLMMKEFLMVQKV